MTKNQQSIKEKNAKFDNIKIKRFQKTLNRQSNFEKKKIERTTLIDFKTYYKVIVIKIS